MYSNHDEINNPTLLTQVRRIPDAHKLQANEQDNDVDTELEEDADPAHITTVPFSPTKFGSFQ